MARFRFKVTEMKQTTDVPEASYGVLTCDQPNSGEEEAAEQVRRLGYAVLDSGYGPAQLQALSERFDQAHEGYLATWGMERLRGLNEHWTIRALLTHADATFMDLAVTPVLLKVLRLLIEGKFILNQQNGIINPPRESYNQGAWHRDLPYQHFVSSRPLAVNALFCIDDFTRDNGSTFVLPASHKMEAFPSKQYVKNNALQVEARAGQFILLDCMLFHSGGFNKSDRKRRAVNHVYNIPYFKQQINLPGNMSADGLSAEMQELLGFNYQEPVSIEQYLASRSMKAGA
jgi:ectoine hydroxylase-related dioxygenase (phytanoyl-CoA dioxygenase family)